MPDPKHIAALEVAKYWQEFGTPTKSQCIKIAEQAIDAYLEARANSCRRNNTEVSRFGPFRFLTLPTGAHHQGPNDTTGCDGTRWSGKYLLSRKSERWFAPGRARTCNLWLRRPTLYPIGLRARECETGSVIRLGDARRRAGANRARRGNGNIPGNQGFHTR